MLEKISNLRNAQILTKNEQKSISGGNGVMCAPISPSRPCVCSDQPACGWPIGHICSNGQPAVCG